MSNSTPPPKSIFVLGEADKAKKAADKQKREEERLERIRIKEAEQARREEEKRRREEEKQRKDAEKEAERLRKEEEKRKKDEEREQERLRKEEERRKKEEERVRKEEEKRKKDDEREQERLRKEEEKRRKDMEKEQERVKREEEKRKREDEKEQERLKKKIKLDEQELKAKKQVEFMQSFLKKTPAPPSSSHSTDVTMEIDSPETPKFRAMPFQLKSGMALAPLHRRPSVSLTTVRKELFSAPVEEAPAFEPYLVDLKKRGGRKTPRTEVTKPNDDEVEIIDPKRAIEDPAEAGLMKWRWKLLQFDKNVRPPYWGTWKRKAALVNGRKPFMKEEEMDYDFDSDQEWEGEPEDGEDLGDKDDDDKEEDEKCSTGGVEDDGDEEDDFLVPHGYLSDDEGGVSEYRDKESLKTLEEEFYRDLKKERVNGLPVIETDHLEQYTMIFYPGDESDMDEAGDSDNEESISTKTMDDVFKSVISCT